jgi:phosphopantothenoylcysteine synthetase/decarboxylase
VSTHDVDSPRPLLYLIVCGTPRTGQTPQLVSLLHAAGWRVAVIATPAGLGFLDVPTVEELTGFPVRSEYKRPGESDVLPPATAMAVCPATFNTINAWAAGIANTLALGLITEAPGMGIPVVAAPALNQAQESHPAFRRSVDVLRSYGVEVLYGEGIYLPAPPRSGGRPFPLEILVGALEKHLGG